MGSIVPTSNIGTGGAAPAPPTPVTYLTQWKIVGNSEVHGNEIWSCGEYSAVDGKYHILIQPLGGSIADIALDEPLRKVNDVADTIEFANGVATLTRNIANVKWNDMSLIKEVISSTNYNRFYTNDLRNNIYSPSSSAERIKICLSSDFSQNNAPITANISVNSTDQCMVVYSNGTIYIRDTSVNSANEFKAKYGTHEFLYKLATPTTETIQVPQIEEAESYSCVISQGGKAVEWSSFITNSE